MALGMDPAQGVLENIELSSETITVSVSRPRATMAPTMAASVSRRRMTGAKAEAVQVGLPRRIIGKAPRCGGEQSGDDACRHAVFNQVGQRRGVDHVVRIAGTEQVQEVQPAL